MRSCPQVLLRSLCVLGLLGVRLAAAPDDPAEAAPPPIQPSATEPEQPSAEQTPDKRVFGVLPNYRTAIDSGTYMPITPKQKLTIATKDTIDYPLFLLGGGLAGIAQLTNEHPRFGQGVEGYFHRYGTAYADQAIGNYMTEGLLPVLFREDPRYFLKGPSYGGVGKRTWYAATRIFVTKTDSGRTTFNFSEVVGNSIAAAVGNAYYPGETHLTDNVSRLAQDLATDAVSQILKEFWPDIKRKLLHRHEVFLPDSSTTLRPGS